MGGNSATLGEAGGNIVGPHDDHTVALRNGNGDGEGTPHLMKQIVLVARLVRFKKHKKRFL